MTLKANLTSKRENRVRCYIRHTIRLDGMRVFGFDVGVA